MPKLSFFIMKKFEFFETTADIGIIAYGRSLEELFENAALAMFAVMCNVNKVKPGERKEVKIKADGLESLLVQWLTSLLALRDIHGMMFSKFKVNIKNHELLGEAFGEETKEEHELEVEVKAVTYHELEIKKNDIWKARVILDI